MEGALGLPAVLPGRLDPAGQLGGVPVLRDALAHRAVSSSGRVGALGGPGCTKKPLAQEGSAALGGASSARLRKEEHATGRHGGLMVAQGPGGPPPSGDGPRRTTGAPPGGEGRPSARAAELRRRCC
ncbi:hypothetical protein [Ornithinimicrobium kibberense]|uniref:hypothetical protein n=1 Tax=Ornithinimicrobium kibberense TaxID=282060 RepID=UPI00360B0A74